MDQIDISKLDENQLKSMLKQVRTNCLRASKLGDIRAVGKLTTLAAKINRTLWDLQTLDEKNEG